MRQDSILLLASNLVQNLRSLTSSCNPKVVFLNKDNQIFAEVIIAKKELCREHLIRQILQSYISRREYSSYQIKG